VDVRTDFDDLRQRFDEFAARVGERARPPRGPGAPPLTDDYWASVQDLFTRDLTSAAFEDLLQRDTPDAFRFFTKGIDLDSLARRPWYTRYPLAVWSVFLALAFRLSPARRILFALSVPFVAAGWVRFAFVLVSGQLDLGFAYALLSATLLCGLLVFELRDKLALKGDLEIARQIQFGLLPFAPFERNGTGVVSAMRPANTVGGDYFDIIELGGGRIALAVGDVAGKGIPAALLMALLQGSLRTLITAGLRGPDLVQALNRHLHANIPSNRLITLFYGEYDPYSGELGYVNAGHNAPFLLQGAAVSRLAATGMALGIVPDTSYEARFATLGPGDRLVLFTDGVPEAFDASDNEYGEDRLEAFLVAHAHLAEGAVVEAVREDVLRFCGHVPPRDDMTLMIVARRPAS
jgi:hypothetical protein